MTVATLLIRADASVAIGTGHVMRCLALAQAWQDAGGRAVFAMAEIPEALLQRLTFEGFDTISLPTIPGSSEDAELSLSLARQVQANWLVIDGDRFARQFLSRLPSSGLRTLLLDDFAERQSFPVDVVLNLNFGAIELPYRLTGFQGALLLGEQYVLLRREFTSRAGDRAFPETGNRVLVTLGGSDPENLSSKVVVSLAELHDLKVTLIAGAGNAHRTYLQELAGSNVDVEFNVANMPARMYEADMAVIAAGGTLWELLYMRCVVLSYARNPAQASVVTTLANMNILADMGNMRDFNGPALATKVRETAKSASVRERLANAGRQLIDGKGAHRVVEMMQSLGGRQ
jgi:UDP-2,4-diacetamido-2,4,6-trideoxy-beta-L-altropyranose hydrolase